MIEIAIATDQNYLLPAAVVLRSLSQSGTEAARVTVLHRGIDETGTARLEKAAAEVLELNWVDAREIDSLGLRDGYLPLEAYMRLLLPDVLEADRVIYLDSDILVRSSLSELWTVSLNGKPIGAVQNVGVPFVGSPRAVTTWERRGIDPTLPYFNSGVMVMDLAVWRAEGIAADVIQVAKDDDLNYMDQGALNCFLAGRWEKIDPRWNQHPLLYSKDGGGGPAVLGADAFLTARGDPWIVHFIGPRKPWHSNASHPATQDWRRFAQELTDGQWEPEEKELRDRVWHAAGMLKQGAKNASSALRGR